MYTIIIIVSTDQPINNELHDMQQIIMLADNFTDNLIVCFVLFFRISTHYRVYVFKWIPVC